MRAVAVVFAAAVAAANVIVAVTSAVVESVLDFCLFKYATLC